MKVLLLAAGYATRLYPLTLNKPKPLLEVADKPVIEFIIDLIKLVKEIDKIYIVTNQRFYGDFEKWAENYDCPQAISIINDKTTSDENKLGATGDMDFVIKAERIKDDLLVIAGDNIFKADLADFMKFCISKRPFVTIGLYDVEDLNLAKKYGIVDIDKNNKIIEFKEKPNQPNSTLAAMCLYFFPKEKIRIVNDYLSAEKKKDAPGYFLEWLYKKENLFGYVFKRGKWFDIGDKKSYEEANKEFSR